MNTALISEKAKPQTAKIIAVSSGKGGIGKTFFAVNFGVSLVDRGYKVLIFDGDINLSNVHILTNINTNGNLQDYLNSTKSLNEIITKGSGGVDVLFTGNHQGKNIQLNINSLEQLSVGLKELELQYDFIIIDTAAGLHPFNFDLLKIADTIILITNDLITSLADLYRLIKAISRIMPDKLLDIIINQSRDAETAALLYDRLAKTTARFNIQSTLNFLGYLPQASEKVNESIQKRIPFVKYYEKELMNECFQLTLDNYQKRIFQPKGPTFFKDLIERFVT